MNGKKLKKKNYYLSFVLNSETFAINIFQVLETLIDFNIIEVPDSPEYIEGVINFRGDIIPAIDFRGKFKFPPSPTPKRVIIVVEIVKGEKEIVFGAIVDSVQDVFKAKKQNIKDAPEFGSKYNPEYLIGMVKKNGEYIMLLDIEKVFTEQEIILINESSQV